MPRHFSPAEYQARRANACAALKTEGLEAILLFAPESHYWLTGYDTFGFAMFQCMVLTAGGEVGLLTRAPDKLQARETSVLSEEEVHIWSEFEGADPVLDLKHLLADMGVSQTHLGFESRTAGLTDYWGSRIREAFPNLKDASDVFPTLRRIKSLAEIEMHRKAANLSDDALAAALATTQAGAYEGHILAEMQAAVLRGGGDYAGNEFVLGSGTGALLCRSASGRRHLSENDQLTIEWSGAYARYHAAMMQTLIIGTPEPAHSRMFEAAENALEACEAAIKPGAPMGDVFDAHVAALDRHNMAHASLQACGYGMGAVYPPIWVDFPMFYQGNPLQMQVNQVFFLHMILMDADSGCAFCLGHSVLVQEQGIERLSRFEPQMFVL